MKGDPQRRGLKAVPGAGRGPLLLSPLLRLSGRDFRGQFRSQGVSPPEARAPDTAPRGSAPLSCARKAGRRRGFLIYVLTRRTTVSLILSPIRGRSTSASLPAEPQRPVEQTRDGQEAA